MYRLTNHLVWLHIVMTKHKIIENIDLFHLYGIKNDFQSNGLAALST
ncbi:hypothetical protein [Cardinium endosymbiont of Oedothorax gibbosus]|nr:hypothetical protein [Cardinium endosymbiont of Oedothorax gibbosus]